MFVYRIVKHKKRVNDLSGTGAYKYGGRWNNKGTYMLYASENSSLAFLEVLAHFNASEYPPDLYSVKIKIEDKALIYILPEKSYPANWLQHENLENKTFGDKWMEEKKFLGIKVRSAINSMEFNYLLNPLFPGFHNLITVADIKKIVLDDRLIR